MVPRRGGKRGSCYSGTTLAVDQGRRHHAHRRSLCGCAITPSRLRRRYDLSYRSFGRACHDVAAGCDCAMSGGTL